MTISRIAKTKQGRFSLFDENGDFLFSIDGETMVKNHVREGAALDAASLEALKEQSDTRKAKDKALGYLSLRDHASGELYDKLCRKFDARSAAAAVAEMQRLGLIFCPAQGKISGGPEPLSTGDPAQAGGEGH